MSFSVNLATGGFYCFGCNAKGGDAVDFVKLRDKVDFKRAAQLLGAWHDRDITPTEKREIRQQHRRPKPKEPPMSLDQILARKLAMAVEYGMEMPADASE